MQLNKRGEGLLPQPVQLLRQQVDLLGVPLGCVHQALPRSDVAEALLGRPDLGLALLDATATTNNLRLLPLLSAALRGSALWCPQTPDVLALDHILLELPQLLLQHIVLHLPHLRCMGHGSVLLLERGLLLLGRVAKVLDLALEEVCLSLVAPLLAALQERLQVFRYSQHVHVLRPLLEVRRLHLEFLVLPLDEAQFLPEFLDRFQRGHLVLAQLEDARVPGLDHVVLDDDGVGVVGDHRGLRHLDLPLSQSKQDLDVVLFPFHQVDVLLQLLLELLASLGCVVALSLQVRHQGGHLLELDRPLLHLHLRLHSFLPQLQHELEVLFLDAFGALEDNIVLVGGRADQRRLRCAQVRIRIRAINRCGHRADGRGRHRGRSSRSLLPGLRLFLLVVLLIRGGARLGLALPEELQQGRDRLGLQTRLREGLPEVLGGGNLALVPHAIVLPSLLRSNLPGELLHLGLGFAQLVPSLLHVLVRLL
mmetsp:Transcript_31650/g.91186  ORF Transcript_31650/g.91186 Transcript_31650/m.91186 type:complete len:479 (-) Transcript_31650:3746-5182(-)